MECIEQTGKVPRGHFNGWFQSGKTVALHRRLIRAFKGGLWLSGTSKPKSAKTPCKALYARNTGVWGRNGRAQPPTNGASRPPAEACAKECEETNEGMTAAGRFPFGVECEGTTPKGESPYRVM